MDEILKILIGAALLVAGYFIGNWLANTTTEEIMKGKKWFLFLVIIGLAGGIYGFISGSDFLLFTMFFIAIVSSRSLRKSLEMNGKVGGNGRDKRDSMKTKSKKTTKKATSKKSKK